ncbi:unnamed protein product, partial [Callosobruchus maculatus]
SRLLGAGISGPRATSDSPTVHFSVVRFSLKTCQPREKLRSPIRLPVFQLRDFVFLGVVSIAVPFFADIKTVSWIDFKITFHLTSFI